MNLAIRRRPDRERCCFIIVNSVTSLNLLLGLLAVIAAASDHLTIAASCVLCGALFDGFDGPLARRWQVASDFGAQLDSLADMTSFIVGGAALAYFWVNPADTSVLLLIALAVCASYVLAGAIRLARFNSSPSNPTYFQGMPTTTVAAIVAISLLMHPAIKDYWVVGLLLLLSLLMVSVFPYPKLSSLMPRLPSWGLPLLVLSVAIDFSLTISVAIGLYVCSGPFISARRRYAARAQ